MCGINGVFHYAGDGVADRALVERQTLMLRHRGPDDGDVWCEGPVALGQRRLSIVDLSPGGHQPMPNEDGSLWVTYNGELYGWAEIRAGLAARGHRVRGYSDTEAFLHLYEEMGAGLFEHLRGMFVFALYDRPRRRLLIGRDRFGIKPLYYHDDGRRIAFASELKARGALKGMIGTLDPHSEFMEQSKYDELKKDTQGEFGGVGIVISMKDSYITVVAPMEDTPGFKAGILTGDRIVKIDGKSTEKLNLNDAPAAMRIARFPRQRCHRAGN